MKPDTATKESNKIIEATRELLKAFGYFVDDLWHIDDIHFICEQQGLAKISDEEAMEVFAIAKEQFDGDSGLSWPQLEFALRTLLHRKQVLSEIREEETNPL